jgi:hypothetical protein
MFVDMYDILYTSTNSPVCRLMVRAAQRTQKEAKNESEAAQKSVFGTKTRRIRLFW